MFFRIFAFAIPIALTGVLQTLYSIADNIIVGRYSGDEYALAAVGSTQPVSNIVIQFLLGFAAGASVIVAQYFGAKDEGRVFRATHTSMLFALIGGVVIFGIGELITVPCLELMDIRPEFIDKSELYMRIIFVGVPALAIMNFGAGILRSVGDSKTPLIIFSASGVANVLLNLLFVLVFHMTVDGVAWATVISQYMSAVAIVIVLAMRRGECYRLTLRGLRIDRGVLLQMIRLGLPSGIYSMLINFGSTILKSAVNSFPPPVVTASSISSNMEVLMYVAMNAFMQASMTFTGQNFGAGKMDRVKKSLRYCIIQVTFVWIIVAGVLLLLAEPIISLFMDPGTADRDLVIEITKSVMNVMITTHIFCGLQEVVNGVIRGLGHFTCSTVVGLIGMVGMRIAWILFASRHESLNTIDRLYLAFPISWITTLLAFSIALIVILKRIKRHDIKVADKK